MTTFPEIHVTHSGEEGEFDWFLVVEDCYVPDIDIVIPKGFMSDFVTLMRFLWPVIPPHGRASMPAILHDYLYENQNRHSLTRKHVDDLFLHHLKKQNLPTWQVIIMYRYVRALGWINWKKYA